MRVLLVQDEPTATRAISLMLRADCGAVVEAVDTGEEAIKMARHYDYDAVVLDLMLPDIDGFEVLRRLRALGQVTPVLALADVSRPQTKVQVFDIGADDVVTKPFDRAELVRRIKAIVRRSRRHSQGGLQVGPLLLDLGTHQVSVDGVPVHLTGKEYAILELLMMWRDVVLTKDIFLNHLYGGVEERGTKIIDVFICKLRKKLAPTGASNFIETVWGRGYTLRMSEVSTYPGPVTAVEPALTAQLAARSCGDILLPDICTIYSKNDDLIACKVASCSTI